MSFWTTFALGFFQVCLILRKSSYLFLGPLNATINLTQKLTLNIPYKKCSLCHLHRQMVSIPATVWGKSEDGEKNLQTSVAQ